MGRIVPQRLGGGLRRERPRTASVDRSRKPKEEESTWRDTLRDVNLGLATTAAFATNPVLGYIGGLFRGAPEKPLTPEEKANAEQWKKWMSPGSAGAPSETAQRPPLTPGQQESIDAMERSLQEAAGNLMAPSQPPSFPGAVQGQGFGLPEKPDFPPGYSRFTDEPVELEVPGMLLSNPPLPPQHPAMPNTQAWQKPMPHFELDLPKVDDLRQPPGRVVPPGQPVKDFVEQPAELPYPQALERLEQEPRQFSGGWNPLGFGGTTQLTDNRVDPLAAKGGFSRQLVDSARMEGWPPVEELLPELGQTRLTDRRLNPLAGSFGLADQVVKEHEMPGFPPASEAWNFGRASLRGVEPSLARQAVDESGWYIKAPPISAVQERAREMLGLPSLSKPKSPLGQFGMDPGETRSAQLSHGYTPEQLAKDPDLHITSPGPLMAQTPDGQVPSLPSQTPESFMSKYAGMDEFQMAEAMLRQKAEPRGIDLDQFDLDEATEAQILNLARTATPEQRAYLADVLAYKSSPRSLLDLAYGGPSSRAIKAISAVKPEDTFTDADMFKTAMSISDARRRQRDAEREEDIASLKKRGLTADVEFKETRNKKAKQAANVRRRRRSRDWSMLNAESRGYFNEQAMHRYAKEQGIPIATLRAQIENGTIRWDANAKGATEYTRYKLQKGDKGYKPPGQSGVLTPPKQTAVSQQQGQKIVALESLAKAVKEDDGLDGEGVPKQKSFTDKDLFGRVTHGVRDVPQSYIVEVPAKIRNQASKLGIKIPANLEVAKGQTTRQAILNWTSLKAAEAREKKEKGK